MKRYRKHIDDLDDGDDIVADGGHVRVRMDMMDAAQREVTEHFDAQTVIDAQLAAHQATAGHRPGFIQDVLLHRGDGQTVKDASRDLRDRTGTSLQEAFRMRDAALAEVERRGANAWRMLDIEQGGSGELGRPQDPGEQDDDLGANGGATGAGDLAAAQKARDDAYTAATERSANAWKMSPGSANRVEQQQESWTAQRPFTRSGL